MVPQGAPEELLARPTILAGRLALKEELIVLSVNTADIFVGSSGICRAVHALFQ